MRIPQIVRSGLISFLVTSPCFAGQTFDLTQMQVIAVSSFEHSNAISLALGADDILNVKGLSQARADLFCQSKEFDFAKSFSTRNSTQEGIFVVYEGEASLEEFLHVHKLIEFMDPMGKVICFGEKIRLPMEESNKCKKLPGNTPVPHLLFDSINCELGAQPELAN